MHAFAADLLPHPGDADASAVERVRASVRWDGERWQVRYELYGDIGSLAVPETALDPARLWEHTCAELFVAGDGDRYTEWNFSPTGQRARFEFARYRERVGADFGEGVETVRRGARLLAIEATLPSEVLGPGARVGLSAVTQDDQGRKRHWALRHPRSKPDFHDAAGFVGRISERRG